MRSSFPEYAVSLLVPAGPSCARVSIDKERKILEKKLSAEKKQLFQATTFFLVPGTMMLSNRRLLPTGVDASAAVKCRYDSVDT
jgi:hypothetical protein